jgi:hypothetical protein
VHRTVLSDGEPLAIEPGRAGDHLISYGEHPFHLSADLATLACSPPGEPDPGWQRALVDWVSYCAAAIAGIECLHAAALALARGAVAIAAPAGGGKTTLAAELVAGGARFLCDDVLALEPRDGEVLALPGPPFAGVSAADRGLAERLGTPRAALGDDLWVAVERPCREPVPLRAVVVLARRKGGARPAEITAESFFALRELTIGLPHLHGREGRRFAILAALADQATLLRLEADAAIPAAELARSLEARLDDEGLS